MSTEDAKICGVPNFSPKKKPSSNITRTDFDSGPISVDTIEENLYLGNLKAASDVKFLQELNITHILTVDAVPLPRYVTEKSNVINKYIQVADIPKEDLMTHFLETNKFIKSGQESGAVLVHCYYGMSRSASVVIAYIMAKYGLCYDDAFEIVKLKRNLTCPNIGFVKQLKLYGEMGCVLDKEHPRYKQFRLKMAADKVRKVKILPQNFADLVKPDPNLTREKPVPLVYRCRKCRRIVASQNNIIPHIPKAIKIELARKSAKVKSGKCNLTCVREGHSLMEKLKLLTCSSDDSIFGERKPSLVTPSETDLGNSSLSECSERTAIKMNVDKGYDGSSENLIDANIADSTDSPEICKQTYFVEPMTWMDGVQHSVQGKLHCPKCQNKIGSFSWIMGCQCPCGQKVAPAFYLVPSKVEWSNVVQNVQMTI